jgi:superfamily II DNA or RNA helicase
MSDEISRIQRRLTELKAEQLALESRITTLQQDQSSDGTLPWADDPVTAQVTAKSPPAQKVALFRRLFAGRPDVFPVRWQNAKSGRSGYAPACANEWAKGICGKPRVKCGECPHQAFIQVSDDAVIRHLGGDGRHHAGKGGGGFVMGVYPLLPGEACRLLAADFDGEGWADDALSFLQTCQMEGVPAVLERSRSGQGGHVWIFFAAPVAARDARRLGTYLITRTMERRPEIGFSSYDRLFPSQDTMPSGGFGNLIALPLQWAARAQGNSVFVDPDLRPYDDQWAFLSSIQPVDPKEVTTCLLRAESGGLFGGVRLPVENEDADEPWKLPPSRRSEPKPIREPLPPTLRIVLADQIYIDRTVLPPAMVAQLTKLAAFQNPEFYRAQAMRLSTFGKPRIVSCAELHPQHVGLPRGCLDEVNALLDSHGIVTEVEDHRFQGDPLPASVRFLGELRGQQTAAFEALAAYDTGVLAATTAFGKTAVAAALIARRRRNALILVHRRELLAQWVERLRTFLSVEPGSIGTVGGGRHRPSGCIDVALIQSLVRRGEASDLVGTYGHLIVDECHHLSATSFELAARRAKACFVLGLSATVARKDGHHPIIFMQCGPVRYKVSARAQAAQRGFEHRARLRPTSFRLPPNLGDVDRPPITAIYAALAQDEARNGLIFDDVLSALEARRSPVILTERRDHLEHLRRRFQRFVRHLVVLRGGMSAAERNAAQSALLVPDNEERLILATGRYLGEGFDDPRLDTLFLTMPIAWAGTLAQYVGRLHRDHQAKRQVIVYDYTDSAVPVLERMATKRQAGYRALGYVVE